MDYNNLYQVFLLDLKDVVSPQKSEEETQSVGEPSTPREESIGSFYNFNYVTNDFHVI